MTGLALLSQRVKTVALGHGADSRVLPEEMPVAIVYGGTTQAVMMATPGDLIDFAVGFSLSEHIVSDAKDLGEIEIVEHADGIEAQIWLPEDLEVALSSRRRAMTGPVGCGLCGIDSLAEALRPIAPLPASTLCLSPDDCTLALDELRGWQPLHDETRAVHAAGFYVPGQGILLAREDVGRHNALDKLIGAMARAGIDGATGAIALTSRISVEMVQKCAVAGSPVLLAISSPTAHAVRLAEGANITLVSLARGEAHVFSHSSRITNGPHHVA
jgi:FdhD protein